MRLSDLPWRPLRAASTSEWAASFATIPEPANGFSSPHPAWSFHRWEASGKDPIYLVSRAAWAPGDEAVRTSSLTVDELPNMPRIFPPRFAWCSRPGRDGDRYPHGFTGYLDLAQTGDQGGAFIELHPPAGQCGDGVVDSWIDCTPVAAYHRGTGRPLARRDIGTGFEYRLDRGADSIQRLPMFVRGSEPIDLQSVEAEDEYHLCRTFMRALGAWRERRCPVARWWILTVCADAMLAWQLAFVPKTSDWEPFSLGRILWKAQANPGQGGRIVRGVAWVLRCGAAALEVGAPNHDEIRAWIAAIVRYAQTVQMENGAFYSAPYADEHGNPTWADMGEAWNLYGLGHEFSECPSWQISFLLRALWEAQVQVPELHRRVVGILSKAKRLWDSGPRVPDQWGGVDGLPIYLVTAAKGEDGVPVPVARCTQGVGPARSMYESDVHAVFVRAGLLSKLPAQYARPTQPGVADDALRVAEEFGVDG